MKKIELPKELMSFIAADNKFVFVNDFQGWEKENIVFDGFSYVSTYEGMALKAEASGVIWEAQYCSIRKGNHLIVQKRDYNNDTFVEVPLTDQPLFKDFPVVIITNNEHLKGFAPVCSNKLELALFIEAVNEETAYRKAKQEEYMYEWSHIAADMISLAKFLYINNPNKTQCVLDELD